MATFNTAQEQPEIFNSDSIASQQNTASTSTQPQANALPPYNKNMRNEIIRQIREKWRNAQFNRNTDGELICPDPYCPHTYSDQSSLKRHLLVHTKNNIHDCTSCTASYDFSNQANLTKHQKLHILINKQNSNTNTEQSSSSTLNTDQAQEQIVNPVNSTLLQEVAFSSMQLQQPPAVRPYNQQMYDDIFKQICEKFTNGKFEKTPEKKFRCLDLFCPQLASDKRNIKTHIMECHLRRKNFPCDYCTASFDKMWLLTQHTDTLHKRKNQPHNNSQPALNTSNNNPFAQQAADNPCLFNSYPYTQGNSLGPNGAYGYLLPENNQTDSTSTSAQAQLPLPLASQPNATDLTLQDRGYQPPAIYPLIHSFIAASNTDKEQQETDPASHPQQPAILPSYNAQMRDDIIKQIKEKIRKDQFDRDEDGAFKCPDPYCPHYAAHKYTLKDHLLFHTKKNTFNCQYCTASFSSDERAMKKHIDLHNSQTYNTTSQQAPTQIFNSAEKQQETGDSSNHTIQQEAVPASNQLQPVALPSYNPQMRDDIVKQINEKNLKDQFDRNTTGAFKCFRPLLSLYFITENIHPSTFMVAYKAKYICLQLLYRFL